MKLHKVINDVALIEIIGKGSYSEVYRGILTKNGKEKEVAVKVISKTSKNVKTIDDETQILKTINHPNVVNFINQYNTKNNTYIITELCALGTFKKFVSQKYSNSVVPEKQAQSYMQQICLGVKELHRLGIVHRDLKPDNIFITKNFMIKIGDFGFAKLLGESEVLFSFKGTPINMAPEIFKTDQHLIASYDKKCDIWSLGTILYEMIYGTVLAGNIKTMKELAGFLLSEKDPEIQETKNASSSCRHLISIMLKKNPIDRADIDTILEHEWFNEVVDNPLHTSMLIKSFYDNETDTIKLIDQNLFENEKLKKFVCFCFKEQIILCIKNLTLKIKESIEIALQIVSQLSEHIEQYPVLSDLSKYLLLKNYFLYEKMTAITIGCESSYPAVALSVRNILKDTLKQNNMSKLTEQIKIMINEQDLDETNNDDVFKRLCLKLFEVLELVFKNEYHGDSDRSKDVLSKELKLQKSLFKTLQQVYFDFSGFSYEIAFHKDIMDVDFDPYNIENYFGEFETVDQDDFNESEMAKLKTICTVKVFLELVENLPVSKFSKAVETFAEAFKQKLDLVE